MFSAVTSAGDERPLLIVSHERAPFHFSAGKAEVQGLCIDTLDSIFRDLNITYEVINVPWVRAWEMVKKGEVDAALSVSRKASRDSYLIYPQVDMWTSEFVFFRNGSMKNSTDGTLASVRRSGLIIGIERGASYFDSFWAVFPYRDGYTIYAPNNLNYNEKLWDTISVTHGFQMLAEKRVGLVLADRSVGQYTLRKLGLENIQNYDEVLHRKGYPMPFVKNSDYPNLNLVFEQFDKKLKQYKSGGGYLKIVNRWLEDDSS